MRAGNRLLGQSTVDLLRWNLETPPQFSPHLRWWSNTVCPWKKKMHQEHTKRHTMRVIVMEPGYF